MRRKRFLSIVQKGRDLTNAMVPKQLNNSSNHLSCFLDPRSGTCQSMRIFYDAFLKSFSAHVILAPNMATGKRVPKVMGYQQRRKVSHEKAGRGMTASVMLPKKMKEVDRDRHEKQEEHTGKSNQRRPSNKCHEGFSKRFSDEAFSKVVGSILSSRWLASKDLYEILDQLDPRFLSTAGRKFDLIACLLC